PLQRVPFHRHALLTLQAVDMQRHKGGGLGDAVDGDIDPRRLLVHPRLPLRFGEVRPAVSVMAGYRGHVWRRPQPCPAVEKIAKPVEHHASLYGIRTKICPARTRLKTRKNG